MSLANTIRSNRATIVCGAMVAAALLALWLALAPQAQEDRRLVALVHDGAGKTHALPLDVDTQITVATDLGSNTVAVESGAVRMLDADCPNGTCLQVAPLSAPGGQIVCLPHQLWIEVVPEGEAGGELDVSLAEKPQGVDLVAR